MAGVDVTMEGSQEAETYTGSLIPVKKWVVHIEVRLRPRAAARFDTIRNLVHTYVSSFDRIGLPSTLDGWQDVPELAASVERIVASESTCPSHTLALEEMALQIHVYQPSDSDLFEEFSNSAGVKDDDDDTMAASVCDLPNRSWEGLWDSLIYADDIKMRLLDYIHATLVLSDANSTSFLGTGWFFFTDPQGQEKPLYVARWHKSCQYGYPIDEVESLTAARAGAMAGTEPSDGLRVVNALLTQLDKLKHRKNVLIMSTSNLVKAIDSAFVDRADIVQYVDLPSREAIYEILRTCLCEIVSKGIVATVNVPTLRQAQIYEATAKTLPSSAVSSANDLHIKTKNVALRLLGLAAQCRAQGLSGRALRRLPVLALARYIGIGNVMSFGGTEQPGQSSSGGADVDVWLDGMEKVVREQTKELKRLN
ncbi:hypothetical protein DXG03_003452 [Asterophora parasitica]|uniref:ATPase AAA-type core domain-containing protein n=1 Tax=Asterophora parasitica TaxID=117018 RepID=A0A9P7GFX7_9AGAR|nr:hypothetical protein DXG03_003452 [Asterophora parasitica]